MSAASRQGSNAPAAKSSADRMAESIREAKQALRLKYGSFRPAKTVRLRRSLKIADALIRSSLWKKAGTVGFFAGLPDEPDLTAAAAAALADGKKVFFPRVAKQGIEFSQVRDLDRDFKKGRYGIQEPAGSRKRMKALDLILVPGRVFDRRGGRIGRGAGYYDRLLEKWPDVKCIGIAFREQVVRKVPCEKHDVKMNAVIAV